MARAPECLECRDYVKPDTYCSACGLYDFRDPEAPRKRPPLSLTLRQAVIARDGYWCGICGSEVIPTDVHIDHILPVIRGGLDLLVNLQVAHSTCNMRKGARV